MVQATLDSEALGELNSIETRKLFDTADKLSILGVGRIVNLPQIIVVGDQSSGKSSVLEAISRVHFPVHGGVCTRFATELVLRPGSRRCVTATVKFADSAKTAHTWQIDDFNQEDINDIIGTAKEHMGLSDTDPDFSKDVLRLEIEGPDMYPLTLVDLPGIFHTVMANQSPEGRDTVMELVGSYMKKKNSVILTIVAANNQLANQFVMEVASQHDPAKERTVGVITKPDLLHPGSAEEKKYLQVVRGREAVHNLGLGWHVLRNKPDYDEGLEARDAIEERFFQSGAWNSIPAANRGVAALRKKLSQILYTHIKQSLPTVIDDIESKLSEREAELERLGQPRSTPEDMRAYLIDVAGNFQRLVRDGIGGHYNDTFFGGFDGTHRKFRSHLRNFNRAIRHVLLAYGSKQEIIQYSDDNPQQHHIPGYLQEFLKTHQYNLPNPTVITWAEQVAQLEHKAAANQGTEFPGYANMDLVVQLFQKQAQPWGGIAELHLEHVMNAAKAFVDQVLEHIVGPPNTNSTTDAILFTCVDPFFDSKEKGLADKLQEIYRPFKEGYAMPIDADFQEARERKTAERTTRQVESVDGIPTQTQITAAAQSSKEFGTEGIIDTMQTFYDMALRTFTDNLINLAIESCLVRELPSILSPRDVNSMSDARLAELAAESDEVRSQRLQLQKDITLLKQGLEQCRRYKPRTAIVHSSGSSHTPPNVPDQGAKTARSSSQPPQVPDAGRHKGSAAVPATQFVDHHRNTNTTVNGSFASLSFASPAAKGKAAASPSGRVASGESHTLPEKGQGNQTSNNGMTAASNAPIGTGLFGSTDSGTSNFQKAKGSTNTPNGNTVLFGSGNAAATNVVSSSIFSKTPSQPAGSLGQPNNSFSGFGSFSPPVFGSTATKSSGLFSGLGGTSASTTGSSKTGLTNEAKHQQTGDKAPTLFGPHPDWPTTSGK